MTTLNPQLVLCIGSLPTPSITPQAADFFDNNHSHELRQRLCDQKSRLIQFYDTEIDRRQSSSHLSTFLNQIDQLLNEYQGRTYPPTRPVDDESYSTYFHSKNTQISLTKNTSIHSDGTSLDDSDEIDVCNVQEKATFDPSNEKSSYTD